MRRFIWVGLLAGCGHDVCGGNDDVELTKSSPVINKLSVKTDAVPGDPWELVFVAAFTDKDGDLGKGKALIYLNESNSPTELGLTELFRQSALSEDAKSGHVTMPLRFNESVSDGADVTLSAQLVDAASQRSNCFSMDLHFDVRQARVLTQRASFELAALWRRVEGFFDGG